MSDEEGYSGEEYSDDGDLDDYDASSHPSGGLPGLKKFALSVPEKSGQDDLVRQDEELLGAEVEARFKFDGDEVVSKEFKMGHEVEFLKVFASDSFGIGFENVELVYGEKVLAPSLCLSDFLPPETSSVELIVQKKE